MSLNTFVRTWLPLLLLVILIIFNWPSGKLDFGNTSPWAGLIFELDAAPPSGESPGLLLGCLPVMDLKGEEGFFVCGAVEWKASQDLAPLLMAGRVEDLRLQKINLLQETVDLHRNPRITFLLYDLPADSNPVELVGGLIQGETLKLKPTSPEVAPFLLNIGPMRAKRVHRVDFDEETQKRWRGEPARFQQLWRQQKADDATLLAPYMHGKITIPGPASPDGVVTEEGR
ncbi:MAG: hypothetical protein CBC13_11730 [Planctomycetia bacterium TMED53]|nr:MAG: hypothetical protein CBC13_11730 [Planctomycetia bacterium TMED53]